MFETGPDWTDGILGDPGRSLILVGKFFLSLVVQTRFATDIDEFSNVIALETV
jgi:hypothetical protein